MLTAVRNSAVNAVYLISPDCKTSQFRFPKYLREYQNVKLVKPKCKSEKSKKSKQQNNKVSRENKKEAIKTGLMCVMWPLKFVYVFYAYVFMRIAHCFIIKYI